MLNSILSSAVAKISVSDALICIVASINGVSSNGMMGTGGDIGGGMMPQNRGR